MPQLMFPSTRCRLGTAVRDVTPPVGIYARSWGAASHDRAEGVHRPLTATAAVMAPLAAAEPILALVALDIGWFQHLADARELRAKILEQTGMTEAGLVVNLSHTHAGPNANSQLVDIPGAELIRPYLNQLAEQIGAAILAARADMRPASITYGRGKCNLAVNRDFWDAEAGEYACGLNPEAPADDTVVVARASDDSGRILATLVNYACHPTTLAWQNRLLSPDYIGATREVLERAFDAPALFLQGASGELAPREGYVGDPAVADRNGRQLGYAAAAAIEGLPPAGRKLVYSGIVRSGADLGTWAYQECTAAELEGAERLEAQVSTLALLRKPLPSEAEFRELYDRTGDRAEKEKLLRRMFVVRALGNAPTQEMRLWTWRLGEATLAAIPAECYSVLQETVRQRMGNTPVLVLGVSNETLGYLPPRELYGRGIYQERQSPYAPGGLEQMIQAAQTALAELFPEKSDERSREAA